MGWNYYYKQSIHYLANEFRIAIQENPEVGEAGQAAADEVCALPLAEYKTGGKTWERERTKEEVLGNHAAQRVTATCHRFWIMLGEGP